MEVWDKIPLVSSFITTSGIIVIEKSVSTHLCGRLLLNQALDAGLLSRVYMVEVI